MKVVLCLLVRNDKSVLNDVCSNALLTHIITIEAHYTSFID